MTVQEMIAKIPTLTHEERRQLLDALVEALEVPDKPKRSITELAGLGAEIWEGIDAQEYVNRLRDEWDNRP